jgi:type I restriction enzyme S subunit
MHINAGRITPSNDITISREKAEELREYQLKKDDLVIARRGVMGRCAVVGIKEQGWLCGSGSMVIRTTDQILPEYLQLVLSSPNIVRDLESNAVGSTMVNLNQQIILNLKIPVPSIVKQELIINHVRVLFLLADRIEEYHQNAIKQVEQLTPTLLSKAFCGELVPQDPNDEPAAILLDRIHAERIANPSILKRDLITRKPKMTKMTNESVKKIIDELPSDALSFEDLHKKLAGDYDSFKDILFELLDEDEPSIEQMFDKQAKAIHFIRKQK